MNTLNFICGMGAGALLATTFFLIFLCLLMRVVERSNREARDKADQQHERLANLHEERTSALRDCARSLDVVREWCLQRWQP